MSRTVELPWVDEPVELAEAVELIARADEADADVIEDVSDRVAQLERRVQGLEDGSDAECPSCGSAEDVFKSGVGAAKLASQDALSDKNADALNRESHVCLDCRESFTPPTG
jgi:Mrp family chromosome partitioning ATPase